MEHPSVPWLHSAWCHKGPGSLLGFLHIRSVTRIDSQNVTELL